MSKGNKRVVSTKVEDRILENRVLCDVHVDVDDVLFFKQANTSLMGNEAYAILVVSEQGSTISKEARALSASDEFKKNTVAKAFLVNNLPHRIVGNFYLKVNRPAIPTRIFSDREQALNWLRSMLKKEEENKASTNESLS